MDHSQITKIERFYSRDQQLCKFTGTKTCLHKKRVQLPQDSFGTPTWPRAILVSWNTNMAAMPSCENALYPLPPTKVDFVSLPHYRNSFFLTCLFLITSSLSSTPFGEFQNTAGESVISVFGHHFHWYGCLLDPLVLCRVIAFNTRLTLGHLCHSAHKVIPSDTYVPY